MRRRLGDRIELVAYIIGGHITYIPTLANSHAFCMHTLAGGFGLWLVVRANLANLTNMSGAGVVQANRAKVASPADQPAGNGGLR